MWHADLFSGIFRRFRRVTSRNCKLDKDSADLDQNCLELGQCFV